LPNRKTKTLRMKKIVLNVKFKRRKTKTSLLKNTSKPR